MQITKYYKYFIYMYKKPDNCIFTFFAYKILYIILMFFAFLYYVILFTFRLSIYFSLLTSTFFSQL